jgi:hypothetical protein
VSKQPRENLTGKVFGRLKVERLHSFQNKRWLWLCVCRCKRLEVVSQPDLRNRTFAKCECQQIESNEHQVLRTIWTKITNGGIVCRRWTNPELFIAWALKKGFKPGMKLKLVNTSGHYCPRNCQIVMPGMQLKSIVYKKKKYLLADFCRQYSSEDISWRLLRNRIVRGWELDRAMTEPKNRDTSQFILGVRYSDHGEDGKITPSRA